MAWLERSEFGIGRGETAESQLETPTFAFLMMICAVVLFFVHLMFQNNNLTIALAVSMMVFATTLMRVEYGLFILLIAMLLSPEIEAGSVGAQQERGVNLRYDDILILILFMGVVVKHAFEGRPLLWRPNPINAGIFSYYAVCLISTLLALQLSVPAWDRSVAFFILLKMFEFYIIFFTVGMALTSMKSIEHQLTIFFAVSLIICIYAIATAGTIARVSAPFEAGGTEPNTLGGYLLIVICVALAICIYAPGGVVRWALLGIAGTAFIPFLLTLSRASYIALFFSLIVMGFVSRSKYTFVLVAVVLISSPFVMPDEVIKRIEDTFLDSGVAVQVPGMAEELTIDKSAYERVYVWKKAKYNLQIWPWFGGGISWDTVLDSHFARVIIETGLFGLATFAFLLWRILVMTHQTFRWSRYWLAKGLSLGMFVTTLGLIVHSFGTISFLIVRIMEPYWFLLALTGIAREIAILDHAQLAEASHEEDLKQALEEEERESIEAVGIQSPA